MEAIARFFSELWNNYIWKHLRLFDVFDAIDILLLAVILYGLYLFIRGRRAGKLLLGLAFVLFLYMISNVAGLRAVHRILGTIAPFGVVLLVVIFQPELRDALEKLGSSPLLFGSGNKQERADLAHTVSEVVEAACQIAMADRDGALIVIERSTPLGEYASKGLVLDAAVSGNLLRNIFVDRSPLHDGAVIIRNNRIAVASSKLPLSGNEEVCKGLGTRHRAAVGITEVSDCVVVVVSEERHLISIANNGYIKRDYNKNVDDFQNEIAMKAVQNELRNDLFRLLSGSAYDERNGEGGPKKKRHRLSFRFRWRSTAANNGKKAEAARRDAEPPEEITHEAAPMSDAE